MNPNHLYNTYINLPSDELVAIATDAAAELRKNISDNDLSLTVDMALLVLSGRLPADIFAGICEDCDINLERH